MQAFQSEWDRVTFNNKEPLHSDIKLVVLATDAPLSDKEVHLKFLCHHFIIIIIL